MENQMTIQSTGQGWIVEIPDDFAAALSVAAGSIAIMYANAGKIETEILPPPSPQIKEISKRLGEKYKDYFEEMKRLGD